MLPKIEALGAIATSIVDDAGFPKKGKHSVGGARQDYSQLGKQDNCQTVVSLSVANHHASLPIAHRLYLPETWANDRGRRKKAKVPEDIVFQTKPQIAFDQPRAAHAVGIPLGTVLADPGYDYDGHFRDGVTELGPLYVVGLQSNVPMRYQPAGARPRRAAAVTSAGACAADFSRGIGAWPARRGIAADRMVRGRGSAD